MPTLVSATNMHVGAPRVSRTALALAGLTLLLSGCAASTPTAGAPLVDAGRAIPALQLDIRYAGRDNFVGAPVRGYEAPKCLLLRPAADALAQVAHDLAQDGYVLHVFDCYRPQRAVRHFVEWAHGSDDPRSKRAHYPDVDKSTLLGSYIAETSGHSRGLTLDLTLARCDAGRCLPIDMGTPF
ncbi:M15 family metallopeptidase, partial [Cognatilysobacter segetis]|uniref:M15 family metallopeptidase n=1 Tax=Cognatilysobacter segetis TaxID=2492394 RepID=UPI001EE404A5